MDPLSIGMGAFGLVSSLLGGVFGGGAAKRAAEKQANAAQAASDKVGLSIGEANAPIAAATQHAQELATSGKNRVLDTAGQAKAGMDEMTKNSNAILDPFTGAGQNAVTTLDKGLGEGGTFNHAPTMAELQVDPGYAWRLQQGQLALERSGAAKGGALGGGAAKDLTGYAQGMASQEYQNAFNRYQTDTQGRYDRLFGVSQLGANTGVQQGNNLTAAARYGGDITTRAADTALDADKFTGTVGLQGATQIGDNTMTGARTQADLITQKGNAEASGIIGKANAWGSALGGGANAVSGAITLSQLLKNPALKRAPMPG